MDISWKAIAAANICVFVGSVIQTSVGYGMSLIALPLLMAIDPELIPGPLLIAHLALVLCLTASDRGNIERRPLTVGVLAALPGVAIGLMALNYLDASGFFWFTLAVLVVITLMSASSKKPPSNTLNIAIAGFASGLCGTTTSINGPPLAAVMSGSHPIKSIRATLASFLLVSTLLSIAGLVWAGRFDWDSLYLAAALIPGVILGIAAGKFGTIRIIDKLNPNLVFLTTSTAATFILVVRQFFTEN